MNQINSIANLKAAIRLLEIKQADEKQLLREQLKITTESLKPINLIKHTLIELTTLPEIKESLLNTVIGLVTGYLSKKIVIGSTHNPIKQILGYALQLGVTDVASKNADDIKSVLGRFISKIFSKRT
jgi:hypothetical protein